MTKRRKRLYKSRLRRFIIRHPRRKATWYRAIKKSRKLRNHQLISTDRLSFWTTMDVSPWIWKWEDQSSCQVRFVRLWRSKSMISLRRTWVITLRMAVSDRPSADYPCKTMQLCKTSAASTPVWEVTTLRDSGLADVSKVTKDMSQLKCNLSSSIQLTCLYTRNRMMIWRLSICQTLVYGLWDPSSIRIWPPWWVPSPVPWT